METTRQIDSYSVSDVEWDVSAAVPVDERCSIAATLFVPDDLGDRPAVVVGMPGAALNRKYWDICLEDGTDYSQARYFAERGVIFVAMDYLGGGDSSSPAAGELLTLAVLADANHQAVVQLAEGLRVGTLLGRKIDSFRLLGAGFSLGAAILMVQQANYRDYEGVLAYGHSPITPDVDQVRPDDWDELSAEEKRAIVQKGNEEFVGEALPVYHPLPRTGFWTKFYVADVPEELVRYDAEELEALVPRSAGVDTMTSGFVGEYAKKIEVPIFLAFGDQDIVADTHVQPTAYPACPDIALTVYPGMGHLHNFCDSRFALWDRSLGWIRYTDTNTEENHVG